MIPPHETFNGTWPFAPSFTDAPGFRMHYADEGPRDARETLLLLHGEPTWGYLFREVVPPLARRHRVVVPDHMGFGKSETPRDRTYWLQDHVDNLERFVLALDLRDVTLVMHDFGGPAGMGLAARHPDRVRRVVAANGPTPLGQPDLADRVAANVAESPWFQWVIRAHRDGALEPVLGHSGSTVLSTLKLNGFERHAVITPDWLRAYAAPFGTPAECLGAVGWARGYAEGRHRFEPADEATRAAVGRKPALAVWGMADRTLGAAHFLPLFEAAFPGGVVHRLAGVGHYCFEDAPEVIAPLLEQFIHLT